jgi:hypothetical protein
MFPYGNFIVEMSKFGENVPAWELLGARMDLDIGKFLNGNMVAKGEAIRGQGGAGRRENSL